MYALDAIGNRIREQVFDPAGHLARSRSRTYNSLNQLASDLGAQGQTTSYTYDNNNNLSTAMDPLGHSNGNIYDLLNRLTAVWIPISERYAMPTTQPATLRKSRTSAALSQTIRTMG